MYTLWVPIACIIQGRFHVAFHMDKENIKMVLGHSYTLCIESSRTTRVFALAVNVILSFRAFSGVAVTRRCGDGAFNGPCRVVGYLASPPAAILMLRTGSDP